MFLFSAIAQLILAVLSGFGVAIGLLLAFLALPYILQIAEKFTHRQGQDSAKSTPTSTQGTQSTQQQMETLLKTLRDIDM